MHHIRKSKLRFISFPSKVFLSIAFSILQTHINECDYTNIKCRHPQCTAEVKRSLLAKHQEEECLYRTVQCGNCQETLTFASLEVGLRSLVNWLKSNH